MAVGMKRKNDMALMTALKAATLKKLPLMKKNSAMPKSLGIAKSTYGKPGVPSSYKSSVLAKGNTKRSNSWNPGQKQLHLKQISTRNQKAIPLQTTNLAKNSTNAKKLHLAVIEPHPTIEKSHSSQASTRPG